MVHFHEWVRRGLATELNTLVATDELARHPEWRVFDCRHDLLKHDLGEQQYRASHIPGAHSRTSTGTSPRRRPARTAAIPCRTRKSSSPGSGRRASSPRTRSSPTTAARARWPRACGGCCAGSGTSGGRARRRIREMGGGRPAGDCRGAAVRRDGLSRESAAGTCRGRELRRRTWATPPCSTRARRRASAAKPSPSTRSPGASRARSTASATTTCRRTARSSGPRC